MCGIAGTVNCGNREVISRMADIQSHRGPDDAGVWDVSLPDTSYIGFSSRRLAIIDLSPAGHMPMVNESGSVCITYNGEIYNFPELRRKLIQRGHQFRSKTDTEVVLKLYELEGPDFVTQLNGMFAFAICDLRGSTPVVMMARDHFGVKPLYYAQRGRRFAFASEAKALFVLPEMRAGVDLEALHQYLTFLWVPDPRTMFAGVSKLQAGHYAILKDGELTLTQYWDLTFPPAQQRFTKSEPELIEEVRSHLRRATQAQMISDVPVGAFLSAGLDSSTIVAMMSEISSEPLKTYTITFPRKYQVGESTLDDPRVAARFAEGLGCDHHELVVEPDVADLLPKLIWHMDEPVADPAILMAYLVCRQAREHVTVLLSGVGGDEIFAGYRKHYAHRWLKPYQAIPPALRRNLIEPAIDSLPPLRGTPLKGLVRLAKKMVRGGALSPQDAFLMNCTYLDEPQKLKLYSDDMCRRVNDFNPWKQHEYYFKQVGHADFLNQMLYLDTHAFMVSLNLTYNDKMSMASSVEVRVPFLDRELAEFVAWNVPPNMKMNGRLRPSSKYILRRAMQGILPDEVLAQPKAGFGAPIDYWLAHDLKELVDDLLSETRISARGYFDPSFVQQMIKNHRSGQRDWSMQIWQLITFELWLQQFVDG